MKDPAPPIPSSFPLADAVEANPCMGPQALERRTRSLGWKDFELDDYTLRLVSASFEFDVFKPPSPAWDTPQP